MNYLLHSRYVESMAAYERCQEFWEKLFKSEHVKADKHIEWEVWDTQFPKDHPLHQVNDRTSGGVSPVFAMRCKELNRAFYIIQSWVVIEIRNLHPFSPWVEFKAEYNSPYGISGPMIGIDELTVRLVLATNTEPFAREVLRRWATKKTTIVEMQKQARELRARMESDPPAEAYLNLKWSDA